MKTQDNSVNKSVKKEERQSASKAIQNLIKEAEYNEYLKRIEKLSRGFYNVQ